MWRSLFIGLGISAVIIGVECLGVEKAVLHSRETKAPGLLPIVQREGAREISPPDWAPWSLLSAGTVTMLYSFTLVGSKH
jgi:hypothetical protein